MAIPLGHFEALILATAWGFVQLNSQKLNFLNAALPMADKQAAPASHMAHGVKQKSLALAHLPQPNLRSGVVRTAGRTSCVQ